MDRSDLGKFAYKARALKSSEFINETENENETLNYSIQSIVLNGILSFGSSTTFELGKINILVGPNGSGKSNLIDCIRLMRNSVLDIQSIFAESDVSEWIFKGRPSRNSSGQIKLAISEGHGNSSIIHEIRISESPSYKAFIDESIQKTGTHENNQPLFINSRHAEAKLSYVSTSGRRRQRNLSPDTYDTYQSILSQIRDIQMYPEITRVSNFYKDIKIYSEWSFGRKSNLREAASVSSAPDILNESMNNLALVLSNLINTEVHGKIRDLLNELKESYRDYSSKISFGKVGISIIENALESQIPSQRLSDGTLRFLALASILLNPKPPSLICIEEPELGMHPDMIRMVAHMIVECSAKSQIIVSTHSELLISSLQEDFSCLFAFGVGLSGSSVKRFSAEEYAVWSDENSLGELWTSGELGGNRW